VTALPEGFSVGHWTDSHACTGCTVVLAPEGACAGVDVRGSASGTLDTDALRPGTIVEQAHAILLTGGSLFGLAAAGGVMRYLEERGVGFEIGPVRVPTVAGAVIFDLLVGDPAVRPDAAAGYAACEAATREPEMGSVGGGAGATVAKAGLDADRRPGGLGVASARAGDATVCAIAAVNSAGGIWDDERLEWVAPLKAWNAGSELLPRENTTIAVVATDARLTKEQANRVATVAHDGIARVVRPSHTMYDGDTIFCLASGAREVAYDSVETLAVELVARAIVIGVRAGHRDAERPAV
jgi:L-aminopeptidase/D-esterase-like protein